MYTTIPNRYRQVWYTFYMPSIILASISGFVTFAVLDYLWLAHLAKNFYLNNLASHVTLKDGALVPYLPAIPLVYIVAVLGIWTFVLSSATSIQDAALYGALLGFFMYAFYDFTNLATLRDYPWSLTIVDTLWGTFLVAAVTVVMFLVQNAVA